MCSLCRRHRMCSLCRCCCSRSFYGKYITLQYTYAYRPTSPPTNAYPAMTVDTLLLYCSFLPLGSSTMWTRGRPRLRKSDACLNYKLFDVRPRSETIAPQLSCRSVTLLLFFFSFFPFFLLSGNSPAGPLSIECVPL